MNIRETLGPLLPKRQALISVIVIAIILVALAFYFTWDRLATFRLDDKQAAFWDIIAKFVGGLVAIGGATIALSKYLEERAKANRAALMEAQRPFASKQQEVYYDLVSATSTIGNKGPDDPVRHQAIDQFWWLFWGAVPMVADGRVSKAVDDFSLVLDETPNEHLKLRNLSMNLARECRKSLGFVEYK
jgi:hypothetical protein